MAPGLLYLGLTLLGTLRIQAKYIPPSLSPEPPLSQIPLQPDFQDGQFQGKWFGIGIAGNSIWTRRRSSYEHFMYSDTYRLNGDHSYNVTTNTLRDDECTRWTQRFVPHVEPAQFSVDNDTQLLFCEGKTPADWSGEEGMITPSGRREMSSIIYTAVSQGLQIYTVRVTATDYSQFAMMYAVIKFENTVYFQTKLHGRTKNLSHGVKERFVEFSKSLGLTDDNIIFFKPIDKCI